MPRRAASAPARLSHVDAAGKAAMVDVGDKPVTSREALGAGRDHDERGGAAR